MNHASIFTRPTNWVMPDFNPRDWRLRDIYPAYWTPLAQHIAAHPIVLFPAPDEHGLPQGNSQYSELFWEKFPHLPGKFRLRAYDGHEATPLEVARQVQARLMALGCYADHTTSADWAQWESSTLEEFIELLGKARPYDSREATIEHITDVRDNLDAIARRLLERGRTHDASKLEQPEKGYLDALESGKRALPYPSPEYDELKETTLKPFLEHHYAKNSHHPEHYARGVNGMDLVDVIEMLCDWKSASQRQEGGSMSNSLETCIRKYHITPQLADILWNTAGTLGWV